MAKKKKTRKRGRPSNGPSVSVTFLLPKDLYERVERLRKRVVTELTRTKALNRAIEKGLEREEEILQDIIATK